MFGTRQKPNERNFWNLHADIQSFVATIDEALAKGINEVSTLEDTIKEAEGQKAAIKGGIDWLAQIRRVFPEAKE